MLLEARDSQILSHLQPWISSHQDLSLAYVTVLKQQKGDRKEKCFQLRGNILRQEYTSHVSLCIYSEAENPETHR